jgi:GT2 family glycosyltransferase
VKTDLPVPNVNLAPARHLYGWNHLASSSAEDFPSIEGEHRAPVNNIKFSIVIPTLNQADTIEDTLISIVGQNYQNMEIIVIDGGSSDQTLDILSRYSQWITRLISESDNGQADAINRGFRLAKGGIYAWINSDDYYLPGTFHKVNALF